MSKDDNNNKLFGFSNESIKEIIYKLAEDFSNFIAEKKDDLTYAAEEYASKYSHKARKKIREYPLCSVTGALVAGIAIAVICSAVCNGRKE